MKNILNLLLSVIITVVCNAQSNTKILKFNSTKEGLSKVGVSSISQDQEGFIWIGTNGTGLYKYDGHTYTQYKHNLKDSTTLTSSRVQYTYVDRLNNLWVGTENGLNLFDKALNQFQKIDLNNSSSNRVHVVCINENKKGQLLVGTLQSGLFIIENLGTRVTQITQHNTKDDNSPLLITSIATTKQGKTFIGTNKGLKELDIDNLQLVSSRVFSKNSTSFNYSIESLLIDKHNYLWIGSRKNNGLFKCKLSKDMNNSIIEIEHLGITEKKVMALVNLNDDTVLVGTENDGLFHLDTNGNIIENYTSNNTAKNNLLHNSVWELFVDTEQRVWLGYYNSGVAVSDKNYDKFNQLQTRPNFTNALRAPSVMGLAKDNHLLYIATDGGGIDIYNSLNNQYKHSGPIKNSYLKGLHSNYIETLFKDRKGNLWAGSWDHGLFMLPKGQKHFINYNINNTKEGLKSNTIISLTEDQNGILWIGSFYKGLHSFNPKTGVFKNYDSALFKTHNIANTDIRKVLVDHKNQLWLATVNGLFMLQTQNNEIVHIEAFDHRISESTKDISNSNSILNIYEDSAHFIWIGTRGAGLCKYNPKTHEFKWYNSTTGFPEDNVGAIVEDNNHNIWVSGNSGLTKIDRKKDTYKNFTSNDGLLSNDFNFGAVLKANNDLYFGNFKGVDYFNPDALNYNTVPPKLQLTEFKIFNETVDPTQQESPLSQDIALTKALVLDHNQSVFSLSFTGINFTRPEKNSYAYYLEGYENDWNYVGPQRTATYTNLDQGSYTFKLKAANNDGVWTPTPLELHIKVLPPWWKSNWALGIYFSLLLGSIFLLNILTKKRIKAREQLRNERIQQEQNDALNKKKIQFFTNISHEFRTPLTLILNPIKDILNNKTLQLPIDIQNKHAIIYKNTDRLFRLINELMDLRKLELDKMSVRVEQLNLVSFSNKICSYFKEEANSKNIFLSVDAPTPEQELWADSKMLEKIIFNLLSNAVKITPKGGAITLEIKESDAPTLLPLISESLPVKTVELIISDTGHGFDKKHIDRIFERFYQVEDHNKSYFGGTGIGLEVVQNFVALHKGKIEVSSIEGQGTTFRILFPAGNDHFSSNEIIDQTEVVDFIPQEITSASLLQANNKMTDSDCKTKSKTLLIVEDNVELRDYLTLELNDTYKIIQASNGRDGIDKAIENNPDVIVTDVVMPEMGGFEFCRMIKQDSNTSHIPLLMLTAKATIENRIEGIENGADAYMVKPFDLKLLKLRIEQLINSRQIIFNKYFSAISNIDENKNSTSIDKIFIQKLLEHINTNLSDPDLSVEALASELNFSRSQLYRKVKALTGQTVNEFIRKIRLERAKQLLSTGQNNISETCYSVGFSSPSYFSKCFKAHFGVLPTEIEVEKT